MPSFKKKLESEYKICGDQVKEELDLMCVWFWKEELNWVELGRVKPQQEEPSNNERRPALEGVS